MSTSESISKRNENDGHKEQKLVHRDNIIENKKHGFCIYNVVSVTIFPFTHPFNASLVIASAQNLLKTVLEV
ncbi:MAG: hypothetical protein WCL18_09365 [bacterium]